MLDQQIKKGAEQAPGDDTAEEAEYRRRAKEHTIAGAALGTASAGALVTLGSVACPLCIVAAPLLIGSGLWNGRQARKCGSVDAMESPLKKGDRIQWSKG